VPLPSLAAFAALVALWAAFLWTAFGADRAFALFNDNEFLLGPLLSAMSAAIAHGDWPLRIDTVLGGVPLYNLTQLSPLYPFYLAALPIWGGPFEAVHSLHWITLAHLLVLEVNMYVFLRAAGASRPAAVTGAALVAFGANSFAYAIWVNITAPYAWFPLYLAGVLGILEAPTRLRHSAIALAAIVLLTLASPAQPLIHAILMTGVLVVAHAIAGARDGRWATDRRAWWRIAAVGVAAVLLTAPVLLPAVLEFRDMLRWVGPFPPVTGYQPIPFAAFLIDQLSLADLGGVLFRFRSPAVGDPFVGVVTVALAAVALATRPRSWLTVTLAVVAAYALVSAAGSNLGLAYVNYHLPLLNKIREPGRFLVLFQFALGALAAFGVDALRRQLAGAGTPGGVRPQLVAVGGVAALAIAVALLSPERIVAAVPARVPLATLGVLAALTWVAARRWRHRLGAVVPVLWGAAALALLALEVSWRVPELAGSEYLRTGAAALDQAIERVAARDPQREHRAIFDGAIDKQQAAMLASYRGVRTLNAYFNPVPQRQFVELYYHGAQPNNYVRALGAKFLVCKACPDEATRGFQRVETVAGYDLYEADDVLPRRYVAHRRDGEFNDLADFKGKVAAKSLAAGVLYVAPGTALPALDAAGPVAGEACLIRELVRSVVREQLLVQCAAPGVLVLNEFFDPAWRASVNGVATPALKVNGNQIGVPVAAASQLVELRYRPVNAITGFYVALGTALVLLTALIAARRSRHRR
jgi:hypothetical protein